MGFVGLLGQTVVLGVAAAFTPSLLALQVLVVSGDPWRRRSLGVAVGASAAFLLVGALLLLGFTRLSASDTSITSSGAWLRIVGGVLLGLLAIALFRPHPSLRERVSADIRGYVAHASAWVFLGVAFVLSIKDLSSFVVMAPALHDIATSGQPLAAQAVLLAVLYGLALAPVLAPPAVRLIFGHRADRLFRGAYAFTMAHQFQLVGGMAAVIALFLLLTGLARL